MNKNNKQDCILPYKRARCFFNSLTRFFFIKCSERSKNALRIKNKSQLLIKLNELKYKIKKAPF